MTYSDTGKLSPETQSAIEQEIRILLRVMIDLSLEGKCLYFPITFHSSLYPKCRPTLIFPITHGTQGYSVPTDTQCTTLLHIFKFLFLAEYFPCINGVFSKIR